MVNEFLHQNIVNEVRVLDRDSDSTNVKDSLASLLFDCEPASDVTEPGLLSKLETFTAAVIDGSKILLELVPVDGASVLLLAKSIEWLDSGPAAKRDTSATLADPC